ncbi:MAG: adenosine deaminase [Anaerolineae bacterium]|nr:adenosine deaminase [Anaerolineae bacterium]
MNVKVIKEKMSYSSSIQEKTNLRDLRSIIFNLPKIDLHRHLEGSLRLSTLSEIAHQHGVDLPSWNLEELRPYVQVVDDPPDFVGFLAKFKLLRRFYSSREAVIRVTYEAIVDAAEDNIRYLELRFNPVALALNQGFSFEEVTDWVILAVNQAQTDYPIQVRLIVTINRQEPQYARQLAEIAADRQDRGIVAIDIVGDEINYPITDFIVEAFHWAKKQGLHITAHAAEAGPPYRIREVIEKLEAERIGHGVRAREDVAMVELVRQHRMVLEMCPTSNLQTGIIPKFGKHPLFAFYQLGIPVTINTDDPSISNTTLTDEFLVAARGIGVPFRVLPEMILNAARAAFLPEPEKTRLVDWFEKALAKSLATLPQNTGNSRTS